MVRNSHNIFCYFLSKNLSSLIEISADLNTLNKELDLFRSEISKEKETPNTAKIQDFIKNGTKSLKEIDNLINDLNNEVRFIQD